MSENLSGKLEMIFAHLSINNVRDIQPLLLDAVDEYQHIRSNLTYDQKQKVNFIKTLLYHAEREEWNQARDQLNGAQKAYQEYINNKLKMKGTREKIGYTQLHGKYKDNVGNDQQRSLPWKSVSLANYMFKEDDIFSKGEIERESHTITQSPKVQKSPKVHQSVGEYVTSGRQKTPRSSTDRQFGTQTPDEDEQGPERRSTFMNCSLIGEKERGYPGTYARSLQIKPRTLQEAFEYTEKLDQSDRGAVSANFDPNRPSRIADAYQSLHEKEWQFAFDAIKRSAIIDETAIECLLYILIEAYKQCTDEAKGQMIQFEHAVLNIVTDGKYTKYDKDVFGHTGNIKHMLQYRKEVSDLSVKRLQDSFLLKTLPIIHRRYGIKTDEKLDAYSRQCITVTWRMVIQDPPLHLDIPEIGEKTEFNPTHYKSSSKSGDYTEYIVWPVLRIYKDGPVLCRGIAKAK